MDNKREISLFRLMLCICLFQIAAYWFAGSMANDECVLAIPQPDTPLYYQAARRIAEGFPFSFSHGTKVCTGTTSVMFPFVLAVPYALGFSGDSLIVAGFVLNALFYLVFIFCWSVATGRWIDRRDVQILTAALLALSGHCAYVTFAQSDIGLWLAVSALFAAALATKKKWLVAVCLIIGPWIRPEGMVCVIAYGMIAILRLAVDKTYRRDCALLDIGLSALGFLSVVGVFGLNYGMTGEAQFSSVANKGYFAMFPFAQAVFLSIRDFIAIIKEMFLGLPIQMPRDVMTVPVLGAILVIFGIVYKEWKLNSDIFGFIVYVCASLGGLAIVSSSAWQGTNMDRYLAWVQPVYIMFVALGAAEIGDRLPSRMNRLPMVGLLIFYVVGAVCSPAIFNMACKETDHMRFFSHACDEIMPKGASMGSYGCCAVSYFCSPRRNAHLTGIYSPEFSAKTDVGNFEILCNEPQTRFDYWFTESYLNSMIGKKGMSKLGNPVLSGPDSITLVKADWSAFDDTSNDVLNGKHLVDKIDVGYEKDEKRSDYRILMRWGYEEFSPFVQGGMLDDKFIFDGARVVLGGDEMSVSLMPSKDVEILLRTWPSHLVRRNTGVSISELDCSFDGRIAINVTLDGEIVGCATVTCKTNSFSETSFIIPGDLIKNETARIGFMGDHIACGYWFYQ